MAAPAAVTDLAVFVPNPGAFEIRLTWNHDGVNLDRFEVLRKRDNETNWTSVQLQPDSFFGTGPYSYEVDSLPDMAWFVRALSPMGEVSV